MRTNKQLIIGFLLLITVNLIACTPTPFTRHKSPYISGTILSDSTPAEGIQVYLSITGDDKYCSKFIMKTTTNKDGKFSISAVKEQMDYTPLMTHYFDEWTLCVDTTGIRQAIYSNNRYGQGSAVAYVNIECDLKNLHKAASACTTPLLK